MDYTPLSVEQVEDPRGLIVRIGGHVDMKAAEALADRLTPIGARRPALAVLDLSGVTFIGSMGLAAIMSLRKTVTRWGGRVRLAAVPQRIWDVVVHARLENSLERCDTVEQALATTAPPSART